MEIKENKNGAIDTIIMAHLLENHAEVLEVAVDHNIKIGLLTKLDDAIKAQDATAIAKIQKEDGALIDAILEAEYN